MPDTDLMDLTEDVLDEQPLTEETTGDTGPPDVMDSLSLEVEGEQQPEVKSLFDEDGNKVAKPVREALLKIKSENPSLGKVLLESVHQSAQLQREFPGGLAEVREMRSKLEEFGGLEEIAQTVSIADDFTRLSQAFLEGKPEFVDDMVATDPAAFDAIAPQIFRRYAETNKAGYAHFIGAAASQYLNEKQIPLTIMRLADLVKDNPGATQLLEHIHTHLSFLQELANTPPKPMERKEAPKQDDREEKLRMREWAADRNGIEISITQDARTKALAGRVPSAEDNKIIQDLFLVNVRRATDNQFKGWRERSQQYIKSDDKKGYLRYVNSIARAVVPGAMAAAVNSTLRGQRAPAKPAPKKPEVNRTGTMKPAEGFTLVAKEPSTWELDLTHPMAFEWTQQNRGILKNGKKVWWR